VDGDELFHSLGGAVACLGEKLFVVFAGFDVDVVGDSECGGCGRRVISRDHDGDGSKTVVIVVKGGGHVLCEDAAVGSIDHGK